MDARSNEQADGATRKKFSLASVVARGIAWNLVGAAVVQAVSLGATVIVARWLTPTDYAIGGLGRAAVGLFQVITAQGFAQALIQRTDLTPAMCHSVFWLMTGTGTLIAGSAILISPWIADFYGQPELLQIIPILATGLFLGMASAVPNAMLQRQLRFRTLSILQMIMATFAASIAVTMAVSGYAYFALIVPGIVAAGISTVAVFRLARYRPGLKFSRHELSKIHRFGLAQMGSSLVLFVNENGDYLILRKFWAPTDFGFYYFSYERARQPFEMVHGRLSAVLFPTLSQIKSDMERLRNVYLRCVRVFCVFVFPLHVVLIGFADPLVVWLFGEQWRPAIPVLQVFALFSFPRGFAVSVPSMFLALDKAHMNLFFNLFRLLVILPTLFVLGFSGASILTTSVVLVAIWSAQVPFYIFSLYRCIGMRVRDVWHSMRTIVLATVAMAVTLAAVRAVIQSAEWPAWLDVLLAGTIASAVYLILARHPIRESLQFLAQAWRR